MAESKRGRVSQLLNRLRGQKDNQAGPEELNKEVQEANPNIWEIPEVPINLTQRSDFSKQIHGCDICMLKTVFTLSSYLCYVCGVYMCEKCQQMHDKTHVFVKRINGESERRGKAKNLILKIREENHREGGECLNGESVEVIGRVNVKHELDKRDCYISGLSGLESRMWVAVDSYNYCIKIFCSVSNTLLQYIKFGSEPWNVTEFKCQKSFTDKKSAPGSKTDISVAARDDLHKLCLLAVTFPVIKQIWFIDANKTPIVKTKSIKMDKQCWSICFSEDKIFTLCIEYLESVYHYSIYILSTDGDQIKVIQNPSLSTRYIYDIAVFKGRIYLSGRSNHKVLCMNVEDGKSFSQLTLERWSWPDGISVDHNNDELYVCGRYNNKVYKLSLDLRAYEPLSLDADYIRRPHRLCFINNKLFISHDLTSSLENVVTVVRLLT